MKHVLALMTLGLVVLAGGFGVAYSEYRSRSLVSELQTLHRSANELDLEWQQLLLEQSMLSAKSVIDRVARHRLDMTVPEPTEVIYVQR